MSECERNLWSIAYHGLVCPIQIRLAPRTCPSIQVSTDKIYVSHFFSCCNIVHVSEFTFLQDNVYSRTMNIGPLNPVSNLTAVAVYRYLLLVYGASNNFGDEFFDVLVRTEVV